MSSTQELGEYARSLDSRSVSQGRGGKRVIDLIMRPDRGTWHCRPCQGAKSQKLFWRRYVREQTVHRARSWVQESAPRHAGQTIRRASSAMLCGRPTGGGASRDRTEPRRVARRNWLGPPQPLPVLCATISSVWTRGGSAATAGRGRA